MINKALLVSFISIVLTGTVNAAGNVKLFLDPSYNTDGKEILLTVENLENPKFPKPKHGRPVLFIHDIRFNKNEEDGKSFRRDFQLSFNGLPSFQETLAAPGNVHLDIEPYYLDLEEDPGDDREAEDSGYRSIEADAARIKEAVELILLRHDDPAAHEKKVSIIAYGCGAISARFYLNELWEKQDKQLPFHPVSELIAISPPNHGFNEKSWQIACNMSDDFIEKLNGHSLRDTNTLHYPGQVFNSEAPGSRRNNEPVKEGILYVTLYAAGNRSMTGGGKPSNDPSGRVVAKNLSPDAENREVVIPEKVISGSDKFMVHRCTVHLPEVICKALYTAVHHQAPPDELKFDTTDETNGRRLPIVPGIQSPSCETGIVLLFDTSAGMGHLFAVVQHAVEPFLSVMDHHWYGKGNLGIAVFPTQPWNHGEECGAQAVTPMGLLTASCKTNAIKTLHSLRVEGKTPLLNGIDAALRMFGNEERKTIILLSDGNHNCPTPVNANMPDASVKTVLEKLEKNGVSIHAVGFGGPLEVNDQLLRRLAGNFIRVMEPETSITDAYTSIFSRVLQLERVTTAAGIIEAGGKITHPFNVHPQDRAVTFLLTWMTPGERTLDLIIKAADGTPVPLDRDGVRVDNGSTYTVITLDRTFLTQGGRMGSSPWTVEISAPVSAVDEGENFHFSVLADSPLKLKTSLGVDTVETGKPITITAAVTEDGRPVTGLTGATVSVIRPTGGTGNWFAANPVSEEELESVSDKIGVDTVSRLHRKTIFLSRQGKAFPGRTAPVELPLYDDGTHGDEKSGDGVYTNTYNDTQIDGIYSFRSRVSGSDWEREEEVWLEVKVKPDPGFSSIVTRWSDTFPGDSVQYLYDVEIVPKDRFGNFAGPGHIVGVDVHYKNKGNDGNSVILTDNLDGTYSGKLSLSQSDFNAGVRLSYTFDGEPFAVVEKVPGFRKWFAGFQIGGGFPVRSFDEDYNVGIGLGGSLGFRLSPNFSAVVLLGYNSFTAGFAGGENTSFLDISFNLRSEMVKYPVNVFINAGAGIYFPRSGSVERGVNVGAGVSYSWKTDWAIELGGDFHLINSVGTDPNFFVTYARLVHRF
jgi:hypothetical protein